MVLLSRLRQVMMRAVRVHQWGGPEVLKVESEIPKPVPRDNEVLIKVEAAGVNPVDTYIRSGAYARKPTLPYIPGSDGAGVVECVGEKVTNFKKGDRVYTVRTVSGSYAEYTLAEAAFTGHLPDKLTFAQGAALGVPYYTAYRALIQKAKIRPGETILIHGASGAVGIASVQIAASLGLKVLGTAGSEEGLKLITQNGAVGAFNHKEEGYTDKITAATGGEGPAVIIEMLSNVNLQRDLEIIRIQGRIVVIGCRGTVEINPRLMMGKELQVMGVMMAMTSLEETSEMHAFFEAGGATGWLRPHVGKQYPLEQVAQSHNDVLNNSGATGKLVLTM